MNFKGDIGLYTSIVMAATLVTMVFACASAIPAAKAAVPGLTYYANDGSNFIRSATPFNFQTTDYNFSQTVLSGGGILTTLTPRTTGIPYADLGLGYTFGKLGDITSIPIVGSGSYSVNVYFDMNTTDDAGGNGPFFAWSGNIFTGVGGDTYGLGPTITGSGTITPGDSVYLLLNGNTYTIAQLQSGAVAGIDNNTLVGFWFGIINHPTTAQFEIDLINGLPVASSPVPVGGETVKITFQVMNPMNILQIMGPWIVLALIAAAAAVATYRRSLKKHL